MYLNADVVINLKIEKMLTNLKKIICNMLIQNTMELYKKIPAITINEDKLLDG